jgi:hypothetical protein
MTQKKNMLEALFPDDPKARNRRYAAASIVALEAAIAAGECTRESVQDDLDLMEFYRNTPLRPQRLHLLRRDVRRAT